MTTMPYHTTPIRRYTTRQTPINARRLNEANDQLSRVARDQRTADLRYKPFGRRSGGSANIRFAKISGYAGMAAPFVYAGVTVEHDGSSDFEPENFVEADAGDNLSWTLINLQELGPGGAGLGPIVADSIVAYWPMGSRFAFSSSNYRGTYP